MRSPVIGCSSGNRNLLNSIGAINSLGWCMASVAILGGLTAALLVAIVSCNIQPCGQCCNREALCCHGCRVVGVFYIALLKKLECENDELCKFMRKGTG